MDSNADYTVQDVSQAAINWHDSYTLTKDRILYTREQHHIPGVHALAYHSMKNAIPSLKWHYHENSFEFSVAAKGTISFCTKTSTYRFSGGDVMVTFPNEVHGTNNIPITVGELYWFQLDISDPENFLFMNKEAAREMIDKLNAIPHHVVKANAEEIYPLLKKAFSLARQEENPLFIASYLQLFLHLVTASAQQEPFPLSPDISRTLNYIMDHITEELPLEELASLANLSCSQYKQKFKKQLGISPRRYVNQQKIEYSKYLLLEGQSVTDIAMLLGFNTSSYFSTVFKKYTLYTPMEYVKAVDKGIIECQK